MKAITNNVIMPLYYVLRKNARTLRDFLTLEDDTVRFSRNVGKELPLLAT
jgi:hypothetical protein